MRVAAVAAVGLAGAGALGALGACGGGVGAGAGGSADAGTPRVAEPALSALARPDAAPARTSTSGCDGARLRALPADLAAPGPWPVGVRTLRVAGLRVEIWYPARPGSEAGQVPVAYDLAEVLPPADARRLAAAGVTLPLVPCACVRDLPLDDTHGPYPLVLFVHGLTLFRFESVTLTAHWASRGFVVVAADFPGATLADALTDQPRRDPTADAARLLDALAAAAAPAPAAVGGAADPLAFLAGYLDTKRLGITGHSLGGEVASRLSRSRGDVVITMAERGVEPNARRFATLVVGALDDRVERYARQQRGYAGSPAPKRLVGITGAGHMSFSDVCSVAVERGGLTAVAHASGVRMKGFLARLADHGCTQITLAPARAWTVIRAVTSAALEEVLYCRPDTARVFDELRARYPDVGELRIDP